MTINMPATIGRVRRRTMSSETYQEEDSKGNSSFSYEFTQREHIVGSRQKLCTLPIEVKTRHGNRTSPYQRSSLSIMMTRGFWIAVVVALMLTFPQPTLAVAETTTYRGPVPQAPCPPAHLGATSQTFKSRIPPRIAQKQHARWNMDCLKRQEAAALGMDTTRDNTLMKRDAVMDSERNAAAIGDRGGQPIRNKARAVKAVAAVNSTNMVCNGRADLCDLRYNQVTYPATHNSASYDLKYDCGLATETCLKSTTVCNAQAQNCTLGWETRCTKLSNSCEAKLPKWLHWLCGAFSSTCEVTEQFCLGWEQICTSSVEVCELWGSTCDDIIPDWAIVCLWENQPGHSVAQQLADGIRFLDLGTCLTKNNTQVVMCHGNGGLRALGHPLDSILTQILDFMNANPYEVITVEFNENDGDIPTLSRMIVEKIQKTFRQPSGELMFWSRKNGNEAFPSLREMILANQRIMLFFGDTYFPIPDPKPGWANHKDTWKQDGFQYTSTDTTPAQLNQSYYEWCTQGPPNDGTYVRWQQIDINMAILKEDIISSIKKGQIPQLCIGPLAKETNSAMLDAIGDFCYGRWPYWFRVRVNDYWEGNVFKVASLFNDRNVARVKAGDTITPY